MSTKKKKKPAARLKRRKHGLGLPIHIKKVSILLNIRYYIILPIYIYITYIYYLYIKFPIRIRDFPSDFGDLSWCATTTMSRRCGSGEAAA